MYKASSRNLLQRFIDGITKHAQDGEKPIASIPRQFGKATVMKNYRNRSMSASVKNSENVQK